jgi:hypothetical protein
MHGSIRARIEHVALRWRDEFDEHVGGNAGASDVNWLDPKYRPERTDNVTVTLQREVSKINSSRTFLRRGLPAVGVRM